MTEEGIAAFCQDLGIDPQDPVILVISYHMQAADMCVYTLAEFQQGFRNMGCVHAARTASPPHAARR